jgi:hypothetical protein
MEEKNIVIKSKLSERFETINIIIFFFALFLTVVGIVIHNSEVIIQSCIMYVAVVVISFLNKDCLEIFDKGINSKKYGLIKWDDFKTIKKNGRVLLMFTRIKKNPLKIIIDESEDDIDVEKAYKYLLSKKNI